LKLPSFLRSIDVDIQPMTGWDPDEIQKLLRLDGYRPDETKDPDSIPDEIPNPLTKKGDIIILGNHRLMCGNAVDHEDVVKIMQGDKARMIFTDPPYNVNYGSTKSKGSSERNIWYGATQENRNASMIIANDNLSQEDWVEFNKKLYANFGEFCDGDIYMWGASGPDGMIARRLLVEMGCHWSATIVWVKDSLVLSPANFHRQYEPAFYGWFGKSSFNQTMNGGGDRAGLTDVWNVSRPKASKLHPTMKPVELCEKGIAYSSKEDDIVLDLFGGSGSTLIACEKIHRRCYMMEIEPHYCDVIIKRYEEYTGRTAERLN
jgi:DNA modification methylase